jgi:membrane-bound metal-dependent hydrolase YbcI (DUF457 family)
MFVGHYGPSFAAKAWNKTLPLWVLFLAVQLVDVLWAIFVLLGVEKVRIVPGITKTNALDLYYMPYTHSLVAAVVWSAVAGAAYLLRRRSRGLQGAGLVGAAVFSHWVLDWLVHRPDLPLYDDALKLGLGLWNFPAPAFLLEAALLFGGMGLYLRGTKPLARGGRFGMPVFGIVMLAIQGSVFFGPPPPSGQAAALMALFSYALFAAAAHWLERKRA